MGLFVFMHDVQSSMDFDWIDLKSIFLQVASKSTEHSS